MKHRRMPPKFVLYSDRPSQENRQATGVRQGLDPDRIEENRFVNRVCEQVKQWRLGGYLGVTAIAGVYRPRIILADSEQLESGEGMSDEFKQIAAREIEEFKAEYLAYAFPVATPKTSSTKACCAGYEHGEKIWPVRRAGQVCDQRVYAHRRGMPILHQGH